MRIQEIEVHMNGGLIGYLSTVKDGFVFKYCSNLPNGYRGLPEFPLELSENISKTLQTTFSKRLKVVGEHPLEELLDTHLATDTMIFRKRK